MTELELDIEMTAISALRDAAVLARAPRRELLRNLALLEQAQDNLTSAIQKATERMAV